jgi:type IV pilus assembly protein PilZ
MPKRKTDRRQRQRDVSTDRRRDSDRREAPRVLLDLEVDYECEDTYLFAYITDMSALGIFIRTNNPEPVGTRLHLRFTLPSAQKPLAVEGVATWINPYRPGDLNNISPGMGVRFVNLDEESHGRIVDLIRTIAYLDSDETEGYKRPQEQTSSDAALS